MFMGWIKLHRETIEKAIWRCSTLEQKSIFITLLILANHKEAQWIWKGQKFKCLPGQFITSIKSIAYYAQVSEQNVRTALVKFGKLEFLTDESTKTGRLITILNWGVYQQNDSLANNQANEQLTDSQQTPNKQVTPNKNIKEREELLRKEIDTYKMFPSGILKEFVEYWTEPNKSGTKMRFELEKTWDLKRRLERWAANAPLKAPVSKQLPAAPRTKKSDSVDRILSTNYDDPKYNKRTQ